MPNALSADSTFTPPRRQLRVSQRVYTADGKDRGLAGLLTMASWLLQRLPGMVVEEQRADFIRTLAEAKTVAIEVTPGTGVKVRSGATLLVDIPAETAARQVRAAGRWSRAD